MNFELGRFDHSHDTQGILYQIKIGCRSVFSMSNSTNIKEFREEQLLKLAFHVV